MPTESLSYLIRPLAVVVLLRELYHIIPEGNQLILCFEGNPIPSMLL